MAIDQTALQQALLSQTTLTLQTTAIIVTAQLTLFFGYFGALFLFLRRIRAAVRLAIFFFYFVANLFLVMGHFGVQAVHRRMLDWRAHAIGNDQLPDYFSQSSVESLGSLSSMGEVLLYVMSFGTVLFIFYSTFFLRWDEKD
ncbi:MAG: hypothetical protein AAFR94_10025 [Pseudomonadota bacterium]